MGLDPTPNNRLNGEEMKTPGSREVEESPLERSGSGRSHEFKINIIDHSNKKIESNLYQIEEQEDEASS